VSKLPLYGSNVSGLFNQVPTHGMPGVMGGVAFYPGQLTNLILDSIYDPGIKATIAMGSVS
jgi:hypothetical protein